MEAILATLVIVLVIGYGGWLICWMKLRKQIKR